MSYSLLHPFCYLAQKVRKSYLYIYKMPPNKKCLSVDGDFLTVTALKHPLSIAIENRLYLLQGWSYCLLYCLHQSCSSAYSVLMIKASEITILTDFNNKQENDLVRYHDHGYKKLNACILLLLHMVFFIT